MAFKAKDSVVIGADRQGTLPDGTVREISKVFEIGPTALVALSSNDYGWTNNLVQRIRDASSSGPIPKVIEATEDYDADVFRKYSNKYPEFRQYAGVIGVYDEGPKLFDFFSTSTVRPELERAFILTGEARRSAEPLIREATLLMYYAWGGDPEANEVERTWTRFSPYLVAQFCALLFLTLPAIESSVSDRSNIYRIDKSGRHEYKLRELFPSYPYDLWPTLVQSALAEVSPKEVVALDKIYGVVPKKLRQIFYDYAEGN